MMNSPSTSLTYPAFGLPHAASRQPLSAWSDDYQEWLLGFKTYLTVSIRILGQKALTLRQSFADALDRRWAERQVPKMYRPFAIYWLFVVGGDSIETYRSRDADAVAFGHDALGMAAITERLFAANDVQSEIVAILDQIEEQIRDLAESIPNGGI